MKTLRTIFLVALLALPGIAFAGAPWTYVDLSYLTADSPQSSSNDDRTTGVGLRGSIGTNLFHAGLDLVGAEAGGGKSKGGSDVSGGNIYVGLHPAMTDNTDLVLDLGYEVLEEEFESGSSTLKVDYNNLFLRAGPRALLAGDKLELSGYITVALGDADPDFSSSSTDTTNVGFQVGGQYYFTPAWSLGAEAQVNGNNVSSDDLLRIFVRWSFGNLGQ